MAASFLCAAVGLSYILVKQHTGRGARDILRSINFYNSQKSDNLEERVSVLKRRIDSLWKNSPSIICAQVQDHTHKQHGIDFVITEVTKFIKYRSTQGFRQSDVFLKPFEPGICIEENLTQKHRLIFNKYPARQNHVLVITKEPDPQTERLTKEDFKAALLTLKVCDEAFMYFNCGALAGASQSHKHM